MDQSKSLAEQGVKNNSTVMIMLLQDQGRDETSIITVLRAATLGKERELVIFGGLGGNSPFYDDFWEN